MRYEWRDQQNADPAAQVANAVDQREAGSDQIGMRSSLAINIPGD